MLKLDADGNVGPGYPDTWQKTYRGNELERVGSVLQTTDDDYVVTGGTQSLGYAGLLIRLDSNGKVTDGCQTMGIGQCLVVKTCIYGWCVRGLLTGMQV